MHPLPDLDPALSPVLSVIIDSLADVQRIFDEQLRSELPPVAQLVAHIDHYRGKMLRPMLVLVSGLTAHPRVGEGRAGGGESTDLRSLLSPQHIATAAVCEMVHMATLVHDDVLDEADTRRRGDTVNRLHGNETAVILGDYLIASAYHLCSRASTPRAAVAVGRASTVMCAGELLQLHHRGDFSLDEPTYYEIVERKTAELIATACELGASLSGADDNTCRLLADFGRCVGVAFQIQDDLLDITGSEKITGKSVGKDLEKGKMTLPLIHYLANAAPHDRGRAITLLEVACDDGAAGDPDTQGAAADLAAMLKKSGSLAFAAAKAKSLVQGAKSAVTQRPESLPRGGMLAMADAVVTRAF